jgi:DNA-binding MarR family transcriptional regulator
MPLQREIPVALRRAYLALHRASEARFSKLGVTADQFVLLASLSQGGALTQRQLARRMSSDPSTVRAMLVLLEGAGLIRRESHPEDGRAKTVALTAAGKRKFRQLWKAGQPIRDTLYDVLAPHEVDSLVEMLNRLSAALGDTANNVSQETLS